MKNMQNSFRFRKQLEAQVKLLAEKSGEDPHRFRLKLAFDRILARLPPSFLLKGGYSMELRVRNARATRDMDLTYLGRFNGMKEPIGDLIRRELQILTQADLDDYFKFQIGLPGADIENAPYGGARYPVTTIIAQRPFVNFHLDVACDCLVGTIETIRGEDWLGYFEISPPTISMISAEQQFAEKLHSYTLPRDRTNTRSKGFN